MSMRCCILNSWIWWNPCHCLLTHSSLPLSLFRRWWNWVRCGFRCKFVSLRWDFSWCSSANSVMASRGWCRQNSSLYLTSEFSFPQLFLALEYLHPNIQPHASVPSSINPWLTSDYLETAYIFVCQVVFVCVFHFQFLFCVLLNTWKIPEIWFGPTASHPEIWWPIGLALS